MPSSICSRCSAQITVDNHKFPGFCSPVCRVIDNDARQAAQLKRQHTRAGRLP